MDTSVRYFSSDDAAAPALTGEAGSLIALLDACLVTGYGSVTLTALTQTDGTATATVDAGHGFHDYAVVEIAGATPAEYNGEHRIRMTSATQFTFEIPAGLAGSATGTITAKLPGPTAWEKAFSGTNKGVYRSTDIQGTKLYLRVDDSGGSPVGARRALVRGFETMTDADTGTGLFPTASQHANGLQWSKSTTLDATARPWIVIANNTAIYLFVETQSDGDHDVQQFGDFASYREPNDPYRCLITGKEGNDTYTGKGNGWHNRTNTNRRYIARDHLQNVGAVNVLWHWDTGIADSALVGNVGMVYPAVMDNGLWVTPIRIVEDGVWRGAEPGLFNPLHKTPLTHLAVVTGVLGLPGDPLLGVSVWTDPATQVIVSLGDW